MSTFKVTGVSRCGGNFKVRFANDMARVKVLQKTGHDEIELVEMPTAVTKGECVTFLKGTELYARAEYKDAIDSADAKYNGTAVVKVTKESKSTKAKSKAAKPSMEDLKARAQEAVSE